MAQRKKSRSKSARKTRTLKKLTRAREIKAKRRKSTRVAKSRRVASRVVSSRKARSKKARGARDISSKAALPISRSKRRALSPPKKLTPQRWYRDLGRREAEEMFPDEGNDEQRVQAADYRLNVIARKRALELDYLRQAVKRLRPLVEGFTVADGFDLRHPERWSKQQADKVRAFSQEIGSILSQPHIIVRPRTKRSTVSLEVFTGQRFKGQKAWIVHVPKAEEAAVKVTSDGKVEVIRRVRGGEIVDRFYLFEEIFGQKPESWDEIVEMTRILIGEKKYKDSYLYDSDNAANVRAMPKGLYTLWVETQGDTDAPVKRELLVRRLREYEQTYGNAMSDTFKGGGFEEVILGFHWQGTNRDAAMRRRMELVQERIRRAKERRLSRQARRRMITRRATR